MKIQILGTGCPKCKKLAELAEQAAGELGLAYELEKVTEVPKNHRLRSGDDTGTCR